MDRLNSRPQPILRAFSLAVCHAFLGLAFLLTAMRSPIKLIPACGVASPQNRANNIPPKPADIPDRWKGLIGEYGPENDVIYVLEKAGKLTILRKSGGQWALKELATDSYMLDLADSRVVPVRFECDAAGRGKSLSLGRSYFERRKIGPDEGQVFRITPARPLDELRKEALAATPPSETGNLRAPDLVELTMLDPTIRLDIRYATPNDFLGTPVYSQARAFLQKPAAEALLRVHQALRQWGYGLLIHDAYRPWYVTKIFWDATPPEGKIFVADPAQGSRHNRGCAVDLTLYDLKTGNPVEMVGTYDEMSARSDPDYPGGTSLQRWHRELLRRAMEAEGFTVNEHEWWHFDYKEWPLYPILNAPFERLSGGKQL